MSTITVNSLQLLKVFIGSPGDLAEERRVAHDVAERINRVFAHEMGWRVQLLGWEDTIPGAGRPQALINKDLDECDVFLGVLWKRWGRPTGTHTSGFEEEYERTLTRFKVTGSPQVWVFFKKVDPSQVGDAGPQLKKVLKFKGKVDRECLFKEFSTISEWRDTIEELLTRFLARLSRQHLEGNQVAAADLSQAQGDVGTNRTQLLPPPREADPGYPQQLTEIVQIVSSVVTGQPTVQEIGLSRFTVSRLFLLSAAWMSAHTSDILGAHETNLLFLHRKDLDLAPLERNLLFRTLTAGLMSTAPGWYWFLGFDSDRVEQLLFGFTADTNDGVQRGALALLTAASIRPSDHTREFIVAGLSEGNEIERRKRILSYLGVIASLDDLPLLDGPLESPQAGVRDAAEASRLEIWARHAPEQALEWCVTNQSKPDKHSLSRLEDQSTLLPSELLTRALEHSDRSIRALSLRELHSRGTLPANYLERTSKDEKSPIRNEALLLLARQGVEVEYTLADSSAQDDIQLALFETYAVDRLEQKINWFDMDGPAAYKALAHKIPQTMSDTLRSDIQTGFQRIREHSEARLRELTDESSRQVIEELITSFDNHSSFVRSQYLDVAFECLARDTRPSDALLARAHLTGFRPTIRNCAIKILGKYGDSPDAPLLVNLARDTYGETQLQAIDVALKLSPGIDGVAGDLLRSGDYLSIQRALRSMVLEPTIEASEHVLPLLHESNQSIRMYGLAYLAVTCSREYLEGLLSSYPIGYYYYDVMCWLDRILYAPEGFREVFRNMLVQKNLDLGPLDSHDSPFPYTF